MRGGTNVQWEQLLPALGLYVLATANKKKVVGGKRKKSKKSKKRSRKH